MNCNKSRRRFLALLIYMLFFTLLSGDQKKVLFSTNNGNIEFVSEAPLELIIARSTNLIGLLSSESLSFAFSVNVATFHGFNSPLQQEHFNENYMEIGQYPKATFTGVIIDEVDLFTNGTYNVRARGKFNIHGVDHIQIIDVNLKIVEDRIVVECAFDLILKDFLISIPPIVKKKIAEKTHVSVSAVLENK